MQAAKNFSREDIEKVLENQGARVPGRMFCSPLVVRWWYEHSHSPGNLRVVNFCQGICCEILYSKGLALNRFGSKAVLLNLAAFASAGGPAEPAAGGAAGG